MRNLFLDVRDVVDWLEGFLDVQVGGVIQDVGFEVEFLKMSLANIEEFLYAIVSLLSILGISG